MPTRFPGGINNATPNTALENLPIPLPMVMGDNFFQGSRWSDAVAGTPITWTATVVGTGTRTYANTTGSFGSLTITNSAADNDSVSLQSKGKAAIAANSGKRIFFTCRYQTNTVNSDVLLGITNSTTTPIGSAGTEYDGTTDGIFFLRPTTGTSWSFYIRSGSTTIASASGLGTAPSGSFKILSFEYVPTTKLVKVWIDSAQVASLSASTFPATDQYIQIALQNGDGNARNMNVDYLYCGQER